MTYVFRGFSRIGVFGSVSGELAILVVSWGLRRVVMVDVGMCSFLWYDVDSCLGI